MHRDLFALKLGIMFGAFAVILVALAAFGAMGAEILEDEQFAWDHAVLSAVHALADPALDIGMILVTALGSTLFVLPATVLLCGHQIFCGRLRAAIFVLVATVGSATLNVFSKDYFARDRPTLWPSQVLEDSYSFPSGHAMGSMTLALCTLVVTWNNFARARPWLATGAAVYVGLIGISRVYLGVHYPSDVFAGWTAAMAWVLCCAIALRPWTDD